MLGTINKTDFIGLLKDGMTIMVGGFLTNGTPETLIDFVCESNVKNLTIICNDGGFPEKGVGKLIRNHQVKTLIASHIGTNPLAGDQMNSKEMEIVLTPQGTLIEQIRAAGAGLGGVLTQTGLDTIVEIGKDKIQIDGKWYLVEKPLKADLALVGGAKCDRFGNVSYIQTMRNFNPMIALAADLVVVEPVIKVDIIDPEVIITPYPLVDYILEGDLA